MTPISRKVGLGVPAEPKRGSPGRFALPKKARIASVAIIVLFLGSISHAIEGTGFSGLFITDTRWNLNLGTRESGFFAVDTRFSGSASDALSGLFPVDTTGAIVGNAYIYGRVMDTDGAGLSGATVAAMQNSVVRKQVATDAGGYYLLTSLPAGVYETRATKLNYLTGISYGLNLPSGGSAQIDFGLGIKPAVPPITPVERPPEAFSIVPITNGQLRVYVNGVFTNGSIVLAKMTVVLTHGWNSNPNVWATNMVALMIAGGFANANFVAWDWAGAADTVRPSSAGNRTPNQGEALGLALSNALGSSYGRPLHFIGHSFGTLVNARAANFLHEKTGGAFSPVLTHITLLDEGEIGVNWVRIIPGFISPVPNAYAWLDNYISFIGLPHNTRGVDTVLGQGSWRVPATINIIQRMQDLHRYAADWYSLSAAEPDTSPLGFKQSFEKQGSSWSPSSSAPRIGTVFRQNTIGSELPLTEISIPAEGIALGLLGAENVANMAVVGSVDGVVSAAQGVGEVLLDVVQSIVPTAPSGTPVYSGIAGGTLAFYADDIIQGKPIFSIQATLSSPSLPSPLYQSGRPGVHLLDGGFATNSSSVWLPISVPSNAALFSFEFAFQGDPGEDVLTASLAGTNIFALEAKYIPTNETYDSGPIPVDVFAGQNVELFFGLVGGTSSNASVTVNAMRFYSIDPPGITIAPDESDVVVSWPATESGFVLETANNLSGLNDWEPVTNAPSLIGLQSVVTNTSTNDLRFYRLRKP